MLYQSTIRYFPSENVILSIICICFPHREIQGICLKMRVKTALSVLFYEHPKSLSDDIFHGYSALYRISSIKEADTDINKERSQI